MNKNSDIFHEWCRYQLFDCAIHISLPISFLLSLLHFILHRYTHLASFPSIIPFPSLSSTTYQHIAKGIHMNLMSILPHIGSYRTQKLHKAERDHALVVNLQASGTRPSRVSAPLSARCQTREDDPAAEHQDR